MSAHSITSRGLAGRKIPQGTLTPMGALLFSASEQGAWYDPSDMSTLFQDSAGTTPVTAMEQPVGLILDKSTGLVLGPELVVSQDLTTWASEGAFGNWGPSTATASVLTSTGASGSRHVKFACTPGTTITASAMGSMAGIATGARLAIVFGTSGNAYISAVSATTTSTSPTQLRVIGTAPSNAAFCEIVVRADGASGSQATFTDVSAKELPGNHASQATSTKRSTYSRRVNLLTKTEQFDDAAWQKSGGAIAATVTANTDIAPDGTLTADSFVPTASDAYIVQNIGGQSVTSGMKIVAGIYTKSATRIIIFGGATPAGSDVYSIQTLAGGWYLQQVVRTFTGTATGTIQHLLTGSYVGAGSYVIWGASLVLATDSHLPYQRVNTDTDYDADPSKFPAYLRFDGVDDALQTGNIDFTSTDKMTVWAGILVSSSSDQSGIFEIGANSTTSNGLSMQCMGSTFTTLRGQAFGTSRGVVDASGFAPNTAYRVCAQYDLSAALVKDEIRLRNNGVYVGGPVLESSGAGNFSSYPLTLMVRGYMATFTGGRLYSLIVRGAQSSLSQIEATELYIKQKMRLP